MSTSERFELVLSLEDDDSEDALRERLAASCGDREKAEGAQLLKRSIDARHGRVRFVYLYELSPESAGGFAGAPLQDAQPGPQVVIVGAGPAGLFCAYELARAGIASTILERGKQVQPRRRDLKGLNQHHRVDPDSNYCFGEGGAGTYSDGKLYTRSHKRGDVRDILEVLVAHGAPRDILVDARPHIGSNKLPKVISSMREALIEVGVTFRFQSRMVGIERASGRVIGAKLASGECVDAEHLVLATGHSAEDIYRLAHEADAEMEAKGFAVGVRIEQPQPIVNKAQYGKHAGHDKLPAAPYRLTTQVDERGVFSFCMCPGGWIVPASTEEGALVVNGMSLSRRDSPFANSGMVVQVEAEDYHSAGHRGVLGGLAFRRAIEQAAWDEGARGPGGGLCAPAQLAEDFLNKHATDSQNLPKVSYQPGITSGDIAGILDAGGIQISSRLRRGLQTFDKKLRGFCAQPAVLVGVETRTSSPLRIVRDRESLQNSRIPGLYPCGEGAGYAGGIVSAALDGIRVARAIRALHNR